MTIHPTNNPPNPWAAHRIEYLEEPPPALPKIYEERARSILAENTSPDVGFRWSVNPYRGCHHGCIYCYARPSHQHLGFGAGSDFERKIVAKVNAPELLEAAFERRSWRGEAITFSGNTDCYQPHEATYRLTRRLLEICLRYRNPVAVITKGALIRRDLDLLGGLTREACVFVYLSIPFADAEMARRIEPWAPSPERRFETVAALAGAGVPVGVSLAPLIPGLNDTQTAEILERAHAAGARRAFVTLVRLSGELRQVFPDRLRAAYPLRAGKVLNGIRAMKGGRLNRTDWHARMRGEGARWAAAKQLFDLKVRQLGFETGAGATEGPTTFRRPRAQLGLFEDTSG